MSKSGDYDNPERISGEKDDGVTSIRRSEIVSIAPNEVDPSKVYSGRQPAGAQKHAAGAPPK